MESKSPPKATTGDAGGRSQGGDAAANLGTYVFDVVLRTTPPVPGAPTYEEEGERFIQPSRPMRLDGERVQLFRFTGFLYGGARWDYFLQRREIGLYLIDFTIGHLQEDGSWEEEDCDVDRPFLWWPSVPQATSSGVVTCNDGARWQEHSLTATRETTINVLGRSYRATVFDLTSEYRLGSGQYESSSTETMRYWFVPDLGIIVRWRPPGGGEEFEGTTGKLVRFEPR